MKRSSRGIAARGFTLVELMIVVSIIGILSTVALPQFQRMTLRARAGERQVLMASLRKAAEDIYIRNGFIPDATGAPGGTITGDWNPAGAPTTGRRIFQQGAAGWNALTLVVEGMTFYSYKFVADDVTGTLLIQSAGDLDGDGVLSTKDDLCQLIGGNYSCVETPPLGQEDLTTF